MNNEDILSGNVAALHTSESGKVAHFETVGKNPDGTFNVSSWYRDAEGVWGAYHTGSYDAAGAVESFRNFSRININDETTSIGQNPLKPILIEPKRETVVKEHRARAKGPDTEENKSDSAMPPAEKQEPKHNDRPSNDKPQVETAEEYSGGTFLEDVEHWIPSLTEDAHRGVQSLKNDLDDYVLEGGSWIAAALAGTALDVMDTAMSFTEGIPLGLLDTRNIGEGFAEGTWEGAKRDTSRALNVLPQGRILRAVDRAITATNVVEALNQGDIKSATLTAGLGVASMAGGKSAAKAIKGKGKVKFDPERTPAFKRLEAKGIIKEKKMNSNNSAWARYQKSVSGKEYEYRVELKDGRTIDIDGLGVHKNGKLVLKEAKLGFKNDPGESPHLIFSTPKADQLKRYFQVLKENPNEISHIELHYNIRTTGEIYKNIVSQQLRLSEIASIDFIWTPFGRNL